MSEVEPARQSILLWMYNSLGLQYAVLLPLAGLICFLLALLLVLRGKGPMAATGLILVVQAPLLIGLFAALQGGIASFTLLGSSSASPKPADVAAGISTALVAPLVGMLVMVPAFAVASAGAVLRSFGSDATASTSRH